MKKDENEAGPTAQLLDALIELQSASWSRSWKRVKAARRRVKELTGIDVSGPLTATLDSQGRTP